MLGERNLRCHGNDIKLIIILNTYSYCLDNLKEKGIFYVQGMTDLLAPLLVIIDDGMWILLQ